MGNNLEEANKFLILEEAREVEDWLTTPHPCKEVPLLLSQKVV